MSARVWVKGGLGVAAAAVSLAGVLPAGRACAGDPFSTLRDALFGRQDRNEPPEFRSADIGRYRTEGGHGFVFDRLGGREALLKVDDDPEIWALTAFAGPRGDMIYKNDLGEPVLRATRLGGLTLFTPDRPEGAAAAFLGQALAPKPPPVLGPEALQFMAVQASSRASRAAQHLVVFEAPDVNPSSEAIFAQAFFLTARAFIHVSQHRKGGVRMLARYADVRFLAGAGPAAAAHGASVQITVAPNLGVAGRPSSQLIAEVLDGR